MADTVTDFSEPPVQTHKLRPVPARHTEWAAESAGASVRERTSRIDSEGGHGSGRQAATGRVDSLQPGTDYRARPAPIGSAGLRVLPGGEDGLRSAPALHDRIVIGSVSQSIDTRKSHRHEEIAGRSDWLVNGSPEASGIKGDGD